MQMWGVKPSHPELEGQRDPAADVQAALMRKVLFF